jgi:hypothetical protein
LQPLAGEASSVSSFIAVGLALVTFVAMTRFRLNATGLIALGAVVGLLLDVL